MSRHEYTSTLALLLALVFAVPAASGEHVPFSARSGVDVARDAALSWAADARLVYLENDEGVALDGNASRWSYLFHSAEKGKARGYSVRDGKILEAADLGFDFDAPPLPEQWLDSAAAIAAAEKKAGRKFREEKGGRLASALLIRGAFYDKKPDATTWTLVYQAPDQPTLFVVVDAAEGKVLRTWRG
jgi:hypothetical protein